MAESTANNPPFAETIGAARSGYIWTLGVLLLIAGLLSFLFAPNLLSLALGLIFFAALTYVLPFASLVVLVFTLPLQYVLKRSSLGLSLPDTLLLASVLGLVARVYWNALLRGGPELTAVTRRAFKSPYLWPTAVLVVLGGFSIVFLTDHSSTRVMGSFSSLRIGLRDYTEIVEPIAVYAMVVITVRNLRSLWILIDTFFLTGIVLAAAGIIRAVELVINPPPTMRTFFRAESLFNQPNVLALYLSIAIPFFAALAIMLPGGGLRRKVYAVGLVPMGAVDLMTGSRGGWVAVGVGLFAIAVLSRKFLWLVPVVVAAFLGVVALAVTGKNRSLTDLIDINKGSGNTRTRLWRAAIEEIRKHPLLGDGLGNVGWMDRYIPASRLKHTDLLHSHNLVLDFWTKLGVGGVIAIFWLLAAYFVQAWHAFRKPDALWRAFGAAFIAAMVASIVHGLVDSFYFVLPLSVLFWMLLGLAEATAKDQIA